MPRISAEQLVFSRLQPAYSPVRRAGYQTAYHSAGLKEVVREIESYINCFGIGRSDTDTERHQFFSLSDGRVVLTYSCPANHPEIVDRRSGAFLCHALVLAPSEFAKVHSNPFWVFDSFEFLQDPEELVERFLEPDSIPDVLETSIPLPQPAKTGWPRNELAELRRLGLNARTMTSRSESVLLLGEPEDISDTLRVLFELVESEQMRVACTFSTHVDNCRVDPGRFWAVGAKKRERPGFWEIDTNAHQIGAKPTPDNPNPPTRYERWLDKSLKEQQPDEVVRKAYSIQLLERLFKTGAQLENDTEVQDDCEALEVEACREYQMMFPDQARGRFLAALTSKFPARLATLLYKYLERTESPARLPSRSLRIGGPFTTTEWQTLLSGFLVDTLESTDGSVRNPGWKSVREFARRKQFWKLLLWSALLDKSSWLRGKQRADQRLALDQMDRAEFEQALQLMHSPFPPEEFVHPAHAIALLDSLELSDCSDTALLKLLWAFVRHGCVSALDDERLLDRIDAYRQTWPKRFLATLKREGIRDTTFARTLQQEPVPPRLEPDQPLPPTQGEAEPL